MESLKGCNNVAYIYADDLSLSFIAAGSLSYPIRKEVLSLAATDIYLKSLFTFYVMHCLQWRKYSEKKKLKSLELSPKAFLDWNGK